MSKIKDFDTITTALMYSELGMEDAKIAELLKEEEGVKNEKDMDLIFEFKKSIAAEAQKHIEAINKIAEDESEEDFDQKVEEYLKSKGVVPEMIELVSTHISLVISIKGGKELIGEFLDQGEEETPIRNTLKEAGYTDDIIDVLYGQVIEARGGDEGRNPTMQAWIHVIYGIIVLTFGSYIGKDLDEPIVFYVAILWGGFYLVRGIYRLLKK